MRLSRYFLPILRETPKEAEIVSHRLMLRAGMLRQEAAGIYAWLPLGLRVLNKINAIVREEQNRAGAIEMLMPVIQSADLWRESGRYDDYGKEMLRIKDRHDRDMLFGPTNEEMITEIFRAYVRSYKDLPLNLYHIQWKFRDEVRPRFGVMRAREFLMKDAYSFDLDAEAARHSYNKMFVAYLRTFARMGLTAIPMIADTGPIGGNLSHEFIILAATGESEVFCHKDYLQFPAPPADVDFDDPAAIQAIVDRFTSLYAATSEKHDAAAFDALAEAAKVSARGIEVGHIFYFGTKYSQPMRAVVNGPDGREVVVHMGSYGIGPSRLVAAAIEANHDDERHHLAGNGRAFRCRAHQSQGRRRRDRRRLRRPLRQARARRPRRALRRPRRKTGRQICDHGSHRPAASDHRRAEKPRRRQGRDEGPPHRPAGVAVARGGDQQARFMTQIAIDLPATAPRRLSTRPFAAFEWLIALRYLRARRAQGFVSVIAGFSFIGITLGVATLIVVMAVMNGFHIELLNKIVGINGHIFLQGVETPLTDYQAVVDRVEKVPGVNLVIPMVEGAAAVSSPYQQTGGLVRGIRGADIARLPGVAGQCAARHAGRFRCGERGGDRQQDGRDAQRTHRRYDLDSHREGRPDAVRRRPAHQILSRRGDLQHRHFRIRRHFRLSCRSTRRRPSSTRTVR